VPFSLASILVVFGHFITQWLSMHVMPSARIPILILALLIRWTIALAGSIGIVGLIYHLGSPMPQSWKSVLPGAIVSTAMWFLTTLAFGWYVTRFANYSQVYGSLGAGVALLFWLYIISLSVLCGAEFNAEFHAHFFRPPSINPRVPAPETAPHG
jgi:membrane protein